MTGKAIRRAAVAGSWYPGDEPSLRNAVESCLAPAGAVSAPGRVVGLISPHAGLVYSGAVAGHAYACLRGREATTVVLVGPSHRLPFDGVSVYPRGVFETPLGEIPVDDGLASALLAGGAPLVDFPQPHHDEHSLEMQLPFLQQVLPGLRIVPLLMGSQVRGEAVGLARVLAAVLAGRDVVLVASSDLSHYHPAPVANRLDAEVVADVERFDAEGLMSRFESSREHACGGGAMVAVMEAARAQGADRATVLRYADSGDAGERDKSRVVGYLAAVLTAAGRP